LGFNRVGNRLKGIHRKKYPPTSDELRQEIEEKLGLGHSPYRLSKYYDVPRNRIYDIEAKLKDTRVKETTPVGASIVDMTLESKTQEIYAPDEITLNGKKYREVMD
jgi:hypothetical protein